MSDNITKATKGSLTEQLADEFPELRKHAQENPICLGCNGLGRVHAGAYVDKDGDLIYTWETCTDCNGGGIKR